jgi:ribosome-associated protein
LVTLFTRGRYLEGNTISQSIITGSPAPRVSPSSLEIALAAARVADDNRGRDILVLDVRELTPIFDYFVIATGSSGRQLHAMADEIGTVLKRELGQHRLGVEGYEGSRWILMDYGDVVVHLFDDEARDYYALPLLWSGAKQVPFEPSTKLRAI